MAQPPWSPDVLTTLAAAATKTSTVRLGTSIVPTYSQKRDKSQMTGKAITDSKIDSSFSSLSCSDDAITNVDDIDEEEDESPTTINKVF